MKLTPYQERILKLRLEGHTNAKIAEIVKSRTSAIGGVMDDVRNRLEIPTFNELLKRAYLLYQEREKVLITKEKEACIGSGDALSSKGITRGKSEGGIDL
jgi:hypothetical protein